MKGLVFTEFIALVEERFGVAVAERVLSTPGLSDGGAYTAVGYYDHREMLALVGALSTETGIPAPALVQTFGEWLFPKLAANFEFAVRSHPDAFTFLTSLDGMIHAEVLKLYPNVHLPHVPVVESDHHRLVLEYRSDRPFADLAEGLLRGCLAWYREDAEVHREPLAPDGAHAARFTITRRGVDP